MGQNIPDQSHRGASESSTVQLATGRIRQQHRWAMLRFKAIAYDSGYLKFTSPIHVFCRRVNILQPHRIRSLSGTPRPFLTSRCFRKLLANHQHNLSGFALQVYVAKWRHHLPVHECKQNVWMFCFDACRDFDEMSACVDRFLWHCSPVDQSFVGELIDTYEWLCHSGRTGSFYFLSLSLKLDMFRCKHFVIVCRFLWAFGVYCERRSDHVSWCLQCNRPSGVSASRLATFLHVRTQKNITINIT